jgi:hypothetical protein
MLNHQRRKISVYRQIQVFVEDLVHSLLKDAREIGVNITPEQEAKLLNYLHVKFEKFYPLPRRRGVKHKENGA